MKNLRNIQLTSLVLGTILGGLGIITALLDWITFVQSKAVVQFTYVLSSVLVTIACAALIVLGLIFLARDEQLNILTVTFLLSATALCNLLMGGFLMTGFVPLIQLFIALVNIGLLIWYLISANLENTFAKKSPKNVEEKKESTNTNEFKSE